MWYTNGSEKVRTIFFLLLAALLVIGCGSGEGSGQPQAMLSEDLQCQDNSAAEIDRWGGMDDPGWAHSCKIRHGKFHVWKGDVLAIEGQFSYGKRIGKWILRDKAGEITKVVVYEDGKIVSEETASSK